MPPRTRQAAAAAVAAPSAAAAAATPAPASFNSLPDPLALQIFGLVGGARDRHRRLPMVCRRWNDLCYSPELLGSLTVHVGGDALEPSCSGCLQTFFDWLLGSGAAQHVQRLELHLLESGYAVNYAEELIGDRCQHVYAFWEVLHEGLQALGEVGALRELVLHEGVVPLALPQADLAQLGLPLRRLHACLLAQDMWFQNELWVDAYLQAFTKLQDLRLTSYHLLLKPHVRLPPSLTALALGREVVSAEGLGVALPQLLAPLTQLRRLGLRGMSLDGVDFGSFSGLQHLALRDCGPLPAAVSSLAALESLAWENTHQMDKPGMEAGSLSTATAEEALSRLTRLTFLSLMTLEREEGGPAQLPPSLSGLARLHTLSLLASPAAQAMPLPASGPYLASVRRLLLGEPAAAASLPALSAMPHLEWLSLTTLTDVLGEMEGYQNYYDATEDDLGLQAWGPLKAWHAGRPQPAPRLERTAQLYAQVVEQTMARELDAR